MEVWKVRRIGMEVQVSHARAEENALAAMSLRAQRFF